MPTRGSATKWGPLWGARPRDWAQNEERQTPTYREAMRHLGVAAGQRVLDVGCGAGVFLRLVADLGARPFGLDASEALVEEARERVPEADVRVGEMESLPYEDDHFDVVTGFNSFFFASDMVGALREARRVAKPDAPVLIQVWGPPERCDLEAMKRVARSYAPPPDGPPPPPLWKPDVLERLATDAGLKPERAFQTRYALDYGDDETLGRLLVSPMGLAKLAGPEREDALVHEILAAMAPYRAPDGSYRLTNEYRYLLARA